MSDQVIFLPRQFFVGGCKPHAQLLITLMQTLECAIFNENGCFYDLYYTLIVYISYIIK